MNCKINNQSFRSRKEFRDFIKRSRNINYLPDALYNYVEYPSSSLKFTIKKPKYTTNSIESLEKNISKPVIDIDDYEDTKVKFLTENDKADGWNIIPSKKDYFFLETKLCYLPSYLWKRIKSHNYDNKEVGYTVKDNKTYYFVYKTDMDEQLKEIYEILANYPRLQLDKLRNLVEEVLKHDSTFSDSWLLIKSKKILGM